jgi:hypothetical protein
MKKINKRGEQQSGEDKKLLGAPETDDDIFVYDIDAPEFSEKGLYADSYLNYLEGITGHANIEFMDVSADASWVFNFESDYKLDIMKYNDVMQYSNDEAQMLDQLLSGGVNLDESVWIIDQMQGDNGIEVVSPDNNYGTMFDHSIVFVAEATPVNSGEYL